MTLKSTIVTSAGESFGDIMVVEIDEGSLYGKKQKVVRL